MQVEIFEDCQVQYKYLLGNRNTSNLTYVYGLVNVGCGVAKLPKVFLLGTWDI